MSTTTHAPARPDRRRRRPVQLLLAAILALVGGLALAPVAPTAPAGAQSTAPACEAPTGVRQSPAAGDTFEISIRVAPDCRVTSFQAPAVPWIRETSSSMSSCGINCTRTIHRYTVDPNSSPTLREAAFRYSWLTCTPTRCDGFEGTYTIRQAGAPVVLPATATSAASFSPDRIASEGLAVLFGTRLATTTVAAPSEPLPLTLGGTTVVAEKNGSRYPARLKYVSPTQINVEVPKAAGTGQITFRVTAADGTVSAATATVRAKAPDVYAADNGTGIASMTILRAAANGAQTFEAVPRNDRGEVLPVEINRPGERVFFIFYASGIRGEPFPANNRIRFTTASGVVQELTPSFAGAMGCCTGVDQINVEIPPTLAGAGLTSVQVFAGQERVASNVVKVLIR